MSQSELKQKAVNQSEPLASAGKHANSAKRGKNGASVKRGKTWPVSSAGNHVASMLHGKISSRRQARETACKRSHNWYFSSLVKEKRKTKQHGLWLH